MDRGRKRNEEGEGKGGERLGERMGIKRERRRKGIKEGRGMDEERRITREEKGKLKHGRKGS